MLALRAPEHAFFTHTTAALLWGAPLPWALERERGFHVSVPAPAPRLHSRDVIGHRLEVTADELTTWGGIKVTTAARTWFDLASRLSLSDLVAVGDYFVLHRAPLASREEIATVLSRADGQRGVRLARQALMYLSERSESRPESLLRMIIVLSTLPRPEINHVLVDSETGKQLRPDFLFRECQVILEYQGDYHRTRTQWRKDMSRRARLEAQGWRVMELNYDDLADPVELVARIQALMDLASVPKVPLGARP